MPSLRCRVFWLVLKVRKVFMNWEAPVERVRAMMARSARFFKPLRDVTIEPARVENVPGEWLIPPGAPPRALILYLHGGAWTLGWTDIHRKLVGHLGLAAGCRALALDYRLAPEHPFPAALDDCLAAYRGLLKRGTLPQDIVIAGDSAGGNLTLATLIALRDAGEPLPAAAVCLSPMTDLEGTGESFRTKDDVALTAEFALAMVRHYAAGQDVRSPLLSPQHADLRGLPPLLIHVGGDEILLSDATQLADKARAAGVDVRLVVWPGLWHLWHAFAPSLPEAQQAIDDVAAFIRERLGLSRA